VFQSLLVEQFHVMYGLTVMGMHLDGEAPQLPEIVAVTHNEPDVALVLNVRVTELPVPFIVTPVPE
jgi:hypothetical protein